MTGFEPVTSSLPRKCSTPELHRQSKLSGRRRSNSRPSVWKAYFRSLGLWAKMDSNHRRHKSADLQSAPFGHSGIRPSVNCVANVRQFFNLTKKSSIFFCKSYNFLVQAIHKVNHFNGCFSSFSTLISQNSACSFFSLLLILSS